VSTPPCRPGWMPCQRQKSLAYPHLWVFQVSMYISAGRWAGCSRLHPCHRRDHPGFLWPTRRQPAALLGNAFALRTLHRFVPGRPGGPL
jgi:hypothetical protein